ncbi:MAG: hypothetical protein WC058_07685 [Phycisphaeraceae bacterium]
MNSKYDGLYPLPGSLAILCEGDVAGYEKDTIEKWLVKSRDIAAVDVWACGTKTAIFGFADAIGRSVPIFAIEDRDYRSLQEAEGECHGNAQSRIDRGIAVKGWLAWQRHEIENYFIEPDILVPVLSTEFGVDSHIVTDRLNQLLKVQCIDQAARATLARFKSVLPDKHAVVGGLDPRKYRPKWNSESRAFDFPKIQTVDQGLAEIIQKAKPKMAIEIDENTQLQAFHEQVAVWKDMDSGKNAWKEDWSGKEVLHGMLQWMAGEFGWNNAPNEPQSPIAWDKLNQKEAKTQLRHIESVLQRSFVRAFLEFLSGSEAHPIRSEWNELAARIARNAMPS